MSKILIVLCALMLSGCGTQVATPEDNKGSSVALLAGQSFYIDCSALTNGNGTLSTPWNNFTAINAKVLSGDSVLLKRGVTCEGKGTLSPKGSGTAAARNIIATYPNTNDRNAPRAWIKAGSNTAIKLFNQSYWEIYDLHVSSSIAGIHDSGVNKNKPCLECHTGLLIGSSTGIREYFRIVNVEASGNWSGMVLGEYRAIDPKRPFLPAPAQTALKDIVVDGAYSHDNEGKGIFVGGNYEDKGTLQPKTFPRNSEVFVRNSAARDNGEDGIFIASTNNSAVENSVASGNGAKLDARYGIWYFNSNDVAIRNNEVYDTKTPGSSDGGALDCDFHVVNCVVEFNYTHDNQGPAVLLIGFDGNGTTSPKQPLEGCTVRYNVSQNDVTHPSNNYGAITMFGHVNNCKIYNNTVYFSNAANLKARALSGVTFDVPAAGGDERFYWGVGSNNTVRNNVFYLANGAQAMKINQSHIGRGNSYDYNLYYAALNGGYAYLQWGDDLVNGGTPQYFGDVVALCAATGQECNGRQGNPNFQAVGAGKTGYQINANAVTSPAVDMAQVSNLPASKDFYNNVLTEPRDIGAHQSSLTANQFVANGNAESGVLGAWTQSGGSDSGVTNVTNNVSTGIWSLFTGPSNTLYQAMGGFAAVRTYKLSADVKTFPSSGTGYIGLKSTTPGVNWQCVVTFTNTSYVNVSKTCLAPSNVSSAQVFLSAADSSYAWVDNVSVK